MGERAEDTLLENLASYMNILFELREVGVDLQALSPNTRFSKSIQNFNEVIRQFQKEILRPYIDKEDCQKTIFFEVKGF